MKDLLDVPFAVASDGSLLLGMTHTDGSLEPGAVLERALATGGRVFIGVEMTSDERQCVRTFMHDLFGEAAATVAGGRVRCEDCQTRTSSVVLVPASSLSVD